LCNARLGRECRFGQGLMIGSGWDVAHRIAHALLTGISGVLG